MQHHPIAVPAGMAERSAALLPGVETEDALLATCE